VFFLFMYHEKGSKLLLGGVVGKILSHRDLDKFIFQQVWMLETAHLTEHIVPISCIPHPRPNISQRHGLIRLVQSFPTPVPLDARRTCFLVPKDPACNVLSRSIKFTSPVNWTGGGIALELGDNRLTMRPCSVPSSK
jgi:hypothetical protein